MILWMVFDMSAVTANVPCRNCNKISCNFAVEDGAVSKQSFNDLPSLALLDALITIRSGVVALRGVISDFPWGSQRQLGERSKPNQHRGWAGGGGGAVSPLEKIFFILSYFMCLLKPHEQGISAKIKYQN